MRLPHVANFLLALLLFAQTSSWALEKEIQRLENEVTTARSSYNKKPLETISELKTLSNKFDALEYEEKEWKTFIAEKKITHWPSQTAKQAVGASLFYPPHINEFLDSELCTIHSNDIVFLGRNDIIWPFALATKYEDPRAQHYLASLLARIRKAYDHTSETPTFLKNLYSKAQETFLKVDPSNNTAFNQGLYILAYEYAFGFGSVVFSHDVLKAQDHFRAIVNSKEATEIEKKRSQFQLLQIKTEYHEGNYKTVPSAKDYAEIKFGPGLIIAAILSKDPTIRENFLKEAINNGYYPAYITLGRLYLNQKKKDETLACFLEAATHGISYGYIKAAFLELGDVKTDKVSAKLLQKLYPNKTAQQVAEEDSVKKALHHFEAAGNQGDPQGWKHFVSMYESLHHIKENIDNDTDGTDIDKKWLEHIKSGIEKNLGLGDTYAYMDLDYYTPKLFSEEDQKKLIKQYGPPPYENLWENIKNFLESGTTSNGF